ncbi:hypothetical protein PEX2_076800 [Penicillium expansum]|uniref:Xylanolytic transcriptional activator regulatory domain-containing protein n=1 Tax=Penicillium expansum TaxID=27334 RepID=A0A0A2JN40_PENEN|nr:hypothetical protein PEX2_076800 [Penicillium expansum]KGO56852.1 hypothetical protein PEX2_076800 [Penicillium expansum]
MVSRADFFLQTAVDSLAQSPIIQENVLRDLQAAVWCVFSLYHSGAITKAVVLLAQAYSLACLNGLNRLDDPNRSMLATIQFSLLEEEECRCTIWALFILDRQINYLVGRHFVIDDMLWCVNYPLDNRSLQNGLRADREGYDRDLAALASEKINVPIGACLTRLVCKANVILGRIVTYKNIKPMPICADGAQSRLAEFHELQSALACFWLSLPPYVHNIAEVPPENASQTFWLLIVAHTCSTILFYITEVERRSPGGANLPTERENFICTYKSVDKVVAGLRQVSSLAIDAVLNPMLAPSYFMCCRFILAQWRLSQQGSYCLDLNLVLKLLEQMSQEQAQLPRIYKDIIDQEASSYPLPARILQIKWELNIPSLDTTQRFKCIAGVLGGLAINIVATQDISRPNGVSTQWLFKIAERQTPSVTIARIQGSGHIFRINGWFRWVLDQVIDGTDAAFYRRAIARRGAAGRSSTPILGYDNYVIDPSDFFMKLQLPELVLLVSRLPATYRLHEIEVLWLDITMPGIENGSFPLEFPTRNTSGGKADLALHGEIQGWTGRSGYVPTAATGDPEGPSTEVYVLHAHDTARYNPSAEHNSLAYYRCYGACH